jgi:hypothetical protein
MGGAAYRMGVSCGEVPGFSRLGGAQASKNFTTEGAENLGVPRRRVRMAIRAKRNSIVVTKRNVTAAGSVCLAAGPVSFLRVAPWFAVPSVAKSCLLVPPATRDMGMAQVTREQSP